MKIDNSLFQDYENKKLIRYDDAPGDLRWVAYDGLDKEDIPGVLKASRYVDGRLMQLYTEQENHVGVIAATRLGKTTSYVIPSIVSNAKKKLKRSMIISDPKGELYRHTAQTLKDEGYRVLLINFRDYMHSECWNMLTPIYRKFQKAYAIYDEVGVTETEEGVFNVFHGKIYKNQKELDYDLSRLLKMQIDDVGNDIDEIASMFISTNKSTDPYWEDSAREVLKAFLWAMLEDSREELLEERPECKFEKKLITEDTFSFNTVLNILAQFKDDGGATYEDFGYFSNRGSQSRAYVIAKNSFLENAPITRKCVMSTFNSKMAVFRECAMRLITSCNSFDLESIVDGPIAIYIDYRDELKVHYQIISLLIQDAYRLLIEHANVQPNGKLDVPFYFILDEFGNFPAMKDFETTISACAGRNIFFVLIIQSYAQLNSVYGADVAEIIRDNLNVHVFFGSNNPKTLDEFSRECGEMTRISPLSALNGRGSEIDCYQLETIPLVTKSRLSHFAPGECIVTEANCGYVLWSKLERYFTCKEFTSLEQLSELEYVCPVNPFDDKYEYSLKPAKNFNSLFDD